MADQPRCPGLCHEAGRRSSLFAEHPFLPECDGLCLGWIGLPHRHVCACYPADVVADKLTADVWEVR